MKKLLLIPALMFGTVAMATEYNYEITPLIGYNIAEGNIDVDNYAIFGAELQYNGFDSVIKPELSVLYSKAEYDTNKVPAGSETDIWRVGINGVYEYDKLGFITPLAKVGLGYERMSDFGDETGNRTNCGFVDLGVGAKIPFNDILALKLEAVYMFKYNDAETDSNLALLAGLNIAFGEKGQKAAPVVVESEPEPAPVVSPVVVDGDDDKDGVLNSVDKCPKTPVGVEVDTNGCKIDNDIDKDGVVNSVDKCPKTPAGVEVDTNGCKIDNDIDKDGVVNAQDICPNTPIGEAVNSDGCPKKITLNITFENDSAEINSLSYGVIDAYGEFLKTYTNYSAKIVGYTDSRGSETYNQKLSEKRANAVVSYLIEKGVDPKRLSAYGRGEANPVADNATSEGRAQNRRIEAELTRN